MTMNIGLIAVDSNYPNLAHWADRKELFRSCEFRDFEPRKGFRCRQYFERYDESTGYRIEHG